MTLQPVVPPGPTSEASVQVYLLGQIDFETALSFQRRLVYEVSGDRSRAALVVCEHPPLITVGRQGSRTHILCEPEDLQARQWRVRWLNRGGGCMLHVPGQFAIYPILPLDRLNLGLPRYLEQLQQLLIDVAADVMVRAETRPGRPGAWAGGRLLAGVGVAVRDWVTYYGAYLNVNPALDLFRLVRCAGPGENPMTSLERQRHAPVRSALVRERLVEHFAARFGFGRVSLFTDHPTLGRKASSDAFASHA